MSAGDEDEFRNVRQSTQNYSDGTIVPHLSVEVWRGGVYRGYVECHTHKVSDDSISVGTTVRLGTQKRP